MRRRLVGPDFRMTDSFCRLFERGFDRAADFIEALLSRSFESENQNGLRVRGTD